MVAAATERCRVWPKTASQDVKCVRAHCRIHRCAYIYGVYLYIIYIGVYIYEYIQGVPGGKDLTSGECSLGQTIPI